MMKRIVSAGCAAAVLSLSLSMAAAQTGSTQTGTQGNRGTGASTQQETTVVGCVARGTGGAQNATFMLNNVQMGTGATASAGVSGSTSASPGASATASGTTSTTTTGTAGSSTTTGTGATDQTRTTAGTAQTTTTGTASAQATSSMPTSYMLVAGANQNLANYVGQRVEIRGRVVSNAAESNRNTTPGNASRPGESTSPAGGANERSANNTSRFQVESVRPIGGTCQ